MKISLFFVTMGLTASLLSPAGAQAQEQIASGVFEGADDHSAVGQVELVSVDGELRVQFSSDFVVDRGPDVWVWLSGSSNVVEGTSARLEKLKDAKGSQYYALPANTDIDGLSHVILLCEQFDTRMGIAELKRTAQ